MAHLLLSYIYIKRVDTSLRLRQLYGACNADWLAYGTIRNANVWFAGLVLHGGLVTPKRLAHTRHDSDVAHAH